MLSVEFLDSYAGLSLGFVLWCVVEFWVSGSRSCQGCLSQCVREKFGGYSL